MNNQVVQPDPAHLATANGAQESFRFLAYPANVLVFVSDALGQVTFVSPSWSAFTGRAPGRDLGRNWLELVHADDRTLLAQGLREAQLHQQAFRLMFRYQREDGVFRWLLSQGMAHRDADGQFLGHLALCFDVTPYQEGEAEMEAAIQSMFPLLRQTRLIAVVLDPQGRILFSNGGLASLLQYSGTELMNCKLFERHLAPSGHELLAQIHPDGEHNTRFPAEFQSQLLTSQRELRHVCWHTVAWRDHSGRIKGTILIGDDITTLRREEELSSLYIKAIEATDHAIVVTDVLGIILSVNRAFTQLTGYRSDEVLGQNPRLLQSGRHDLAFYQAMWGTLLSSGHWHGDMWDRHKDGHLYPKYLAISAIKDSAGVVTHFVGIFYDNSERKTIEERLDHLAHYDGLTGLPNRSLLMDRLEQSLERARRSLHKVALVYLDLDHFKTVNDTHGHSAGDHLLRLAAQRMKTCVRAADTVARLGGDEFVVLLPEVHRADDILLVAKKLLHELSAPYVIQSVPALCTPSMGISVFPDHGDKPDDLVEQADTAMYQAKQSGRGSFRFIKDLP